jgi:hypothetical protein
MTAGSCLVGVCARVFVCSQLCCVADVDIPNQFDHTIVLGDLNYRLQAPHEHPVSTTVSTPLSTPSSTPSSTP